VRIRLIAADAGGLLWIDRRRLIAIQSTTPGETELVVADNAGPALRWLVVEPIADVVARLERDRLERPR